MRDIMDTNKTYIIYIINSPARGTPVGSRGRAQKRRKNDMPKMEMRMMCTNAMRMSMMDDSFLRSVPEGELMVDCGVFL